MGKPLVRFCEGPGFNEGQEVRGTRHVVVACDEAFNESLVEHLIHDHLKTSVYSKVLERGEDTRLSTLRPAACGTVEDGRQRFRLRSYTHFGGQDGVARHSAQSGNVGMIE